MIAAMRSELDKTFDVIEFMTNEELHTVRDVTIMSKKAIERPFRTLTEEEYFARVDKGLSELDAGPGEDLMQLMLKLLPNLGLQCSIG